MSPAPHQYIKLRNGERRSGCRYPIHVDLAYTLRRGDKPLKSGTGRTVDLSSRGVLFESESTLPAGNKIEISIAWPALLHNETALNLFVVGQIVRGSGSFTAVRFERYIFRIRPHRRARLGDATMQPLPYPSQDGVAAIL